MFRVVDVFDVRENLVSVDWVSLRRRRCGRRRRRRTSGGALSFGAFPERDGRRGVGLARGFDQRVGVVERRHHIMCILRRFKLWGKCVKNTPSFGEKCSLPKRTTRAPLSRSRRANNALPPPRGRATVKEAPPISAPARRADEKRAVVVAAAAAAIVVASKMTNATRRVAGNNSRG